MMIRKIMSLALMTVLIFPPLAVAADPPDLKGPWIAISTAIGTPPSGQGKEKSKSGALSLSTRRGLGIRAGGFSGKSSKTELVATW